MVKVVLRIRRLGLKPGKDLLDHLQPITGLGKEFRIMRHREAFLREEPWLEER